MVIVRNKYKESIIKSTVETILKTHKNGVIVIDGEDDLGAPDFLRPGVFVDRKYVVGYFHSGFSGINKTGVCINVSDFEKVKSDYFERYGHELGSPIKYEGFDMAYVVNLVEVKDGTFEILNQKLK